MLAKQGKAVRERKFNCIRSQQLSNSVCPEENQLPNGSNLPAGAAAEHRRTLSNTAC